MLVWVGALAEQLLLLGQRGVQQEEGRGERLATWAEILLYNAASS